MVRSYLTYQYKARERISERYVPRLAVRQNVHLENVNP